jgi:hypothetical protein
VSAPTIGACDQEGDHEAEKTHAAGLSNRCAWASSDGGCPRGSNGNGVSACARRSIAASILYRNSAQGAARLSPRACRVCDRLAPRLLRGLGQEDPMKTALLVAALFGVFPALRFTYASENSATPAATNLDRGRCILACQQQQTRCIQKCTLESCPCADQYDACVDRCEALPN